MGRYADDQWEAPPRTGRRGVLVVVLLAVAVAAAAWLSGAGDPATEPLVVDRAPPAATPTAAGRLETGPASPLGAGPHRAVWADGRLVVWSPTGGDGFAPQIASYDPGAGTWNPLPASPVDVGVIDAAAVWTGREVLLWGGFRPGDDLVGHGAAYDPATGSWRELGRPPSVIPAQAAVWAAYPELGWEGGVSGELIVVGRGSPELDATTAVQALAYSPHVDQWRRLADPGQLLPLGNAILGGAWTGQRLLLALRDGALAYDPSADAWEVLADAPAAGALGGQVVSTGREVVLAATYPDLGGPQYGARWTGAGWAAVPPGPIPADTVPTDAPLLASAWTPQGLVVVHGAADGGVQGLLWDPRSGWSQLPPLGLAAGGGPIRVQAVWTGQALLITGRGAATGEDAPLQLRIWRP